ncbi:class I SAM-dependent DNA methyltransferase [Sphingomonas rubra]|uniref:Nodulation protein S (NodS) n=1 Tax=Sphingomonas rubra TaxID=634430 RepID=A0A1I5PIH0_9SPHN|nr:class I SAM-dependent methyltransferase [Sphingomonas rubra]SFP33922.1 Nodulation protein S (NodS) [Sphingomonas rubra]
MTRDSLDARYFDDVFAGDDDPWDLAASPYEAAKFAATTAALADLRYARALEIGCAHGVLTRQLAPLCDDLLSIDISQRAIDLARARCADLPQVRFARADFPRHPPVADRLDLAVLSEVAYYWSDADLARAAAWLHDHLAPGGRVLAVHYVRETDYPQTGDSAVEKLAAAFRPTIEREQRTADYRLDLWRRP